MKRFLIAATIVVLTGLAAGTARAGHGYGFYFQPDYSYYAPPPYYQPPVVIYRPPLPYYGPSSQYSEGERRIMAAHSRYRYYVHPRSQFNGPPSPWGW